MTIVRRIDPSAAELARLAARMAAARDRRARARKAWRARDRHGDHAPDALRRPSTRARGSARPRLPCPLRCGACARVRSCRPGATGRGSGVAPRSGRRRREERRRPAQASSAARAAGVRVIPSCGTAGGSRRYATNATALAPGSRLSGPALVRRVQLHDARSARVAGRRRCRPSSPPRGDAMKSRVRLDPITLAVLHHRLAAIAEEMGVAARPHRLLAEHQGAARLLVRALRPPAAAGRTGGAHSRASRLDTARPCTRRSRPIVPRRATSSPSNDPYAGGTHLPDLTLVAPVHSPAGRLLGFVANRAHHADIGGMTPGRCRSRARSTRRASVCRRYVSCAAASSWRTC